MFIHVHSCHVHGVLSLGRISGVLPEFPIPNLSARWHSNAGSSWILVCTGIVLSLLCNFAISFQLFSKPVSLSYPNGSKFEFDCPVSWCYWRWRRKGEILLRIIGLEFRGMFFLKFCWNLPPIVNETILKWQYLNLILDCISQLLWEWWNGSSSRWWRSWRRTCNGPITS